MKFKRAVTAVTVTAIAAATVAGCGAYDGAGSQPLTYAPAAYGANGDCYYVNSPAEVTALQAAGLCPRSWAAILMPASWEDEYYSYYDSSAYYDTYVPVKVRTVYVQRETTFGKSNRTAITARSKTATYRTSTGTIVKGTSVTAKTRFGSGKSFSSSKYGGGSLRSGGSTGSKSSSSRTGSTGSVSKSSSSRSGSLRSGSSGSRSSGSHR